MPIPARHSRCDCRRQAVHFTAIHPRAARAWTRRHSPCVASATTTQRIFDQLSTAQQAGGAGGATTYADLQRLDAAWHRMRNAPTGPAAGPPPAFVHTATTALPTSPTYDVVVCGGTLGIFYAAALQLQGLSVAVVERGPLRGRAQDWTSVGPNSTRSCEWAC